MTHPEPTTPIRVPTLDGITFNEARAIKAATGVDPYDCPRGQLIYVLGWWRARLLPGHENLTLDDVYDWRAKWFQLVPDDDDSAEIHDALAAQESDPAAPPTSAVPALEPA